MVYGIISFSGSPLALTNPNAHSLSVRRAPVPAKGTSGLQGGLGMGTAPRCSQGCGNGI